MRITNKDIKEFIACPQFGDDHYGKWGALNYEQRLCFKRLIEQNENYDNLLTEKVIEIYEALKYMENYILLEDAPINERVKNEFMEVIKILKGEQYGIDINNLYSSNNIN